MTPLAALTQLLSVIIVCLTISNVATIWYKTKVLEKSKDIKEYEEAVKVPEKPKEKKVIQDPNETVVQELY